jgi:crossover junction endodeoxyribonuclease RuvC
MIILGIDPGTAIMGYGLIEKKGNKFTALQYACWRTAAQTPLAERLLQLYNCLEELLAQNHPDEVAVEELYFNRNTTTAMSIGQARGVVLLSAAQKGIPVYEYTPLQVKQAVAGYGKADKKQVQHMVKVLLGLGEIPKPDDTADALAVAICHAQSSPFLRKMEGFL